VTQCVSVIRPPGCEALRFKGRTGIGQAIGAKIVLSTPDRLKIGAAGKDHHAI